MIPIQEIDGVEYGLFQISDKDSFCKLLADAFSHYEPMGKALELSQDEVLEFVQLFCKQAEDEKLSLVARTVDTNEVIGALLSDDFVSPPPLGVNTISKNFNPILDLLDKLDQAYLKEHSYQLGECLHMFMVAVDPHKGSKGVASHLSRLCMERAVSMGYRKVVVEATGSISQAIGRKMGFVDRGTILYKDYVYEGKKVFENIEGHIGTILMDGDLS